VTLVFEALYMNQASGLKIMQTEPSWSQLQPTVSNQISLRAYPLLQRSCARAHRPRTWRARLQPRPPTMAALLTYRVSDLYVTMDSKWLYVLWKFSWLFTEICFEFLCPRRVAYSNRLVPRPSVRPSLFCPEHYFKTMQVINMKLHR